MRWFALVATSAALALAGCGSGDNKSGSSSTPASGSSGSSGSSGGGASVDVSAPADGSLKFDQSSLTAKAGKVTVKFDNPSSTPHGVTIEGNGVEQASDVVTGKATSFTVDLKPGKYTYFCPVDGHRDAGMKGTLTVS